MSISVPQDEPGALAAPSATANPSTDGRTAVPPHHNDGNNNNDDDQEPQSSSSFASRLRNSISIGSPPKPGTMVRLKYASYLFGALFFCMIFQTLMSEYFGSFSYYSDACSVDDGSGGDSPEYHPPSSSSSKTTTTVTTSQAPSRWTIPPDFIPTDKLPKAIQEAAQLAAALRHSCLKATVVYRVSFALFLFFLLHFCSVSDLTCCVDDGVRDEMQSGYFGMKTCILIMLVLFSFALPTRFFSYYAWVCMYAAALFLLIQIILIVDFAHEWNEKWGDRSEENEKWLYYLVAITIFCFVASICMNGYGFANYTPHEDCNLHGFILIANIMVGLITIAVAIWVPHGSLLPTGIIFTYTSYLVVTALRTSPDTRCGGTGGGQFVPNTSWWQMLGTSVVTAGALAYTASSVGGSDDSWELNENENNNNNNANGGHRHQQQQYLGHLPAYLYFYVIMILASMYLAMLGTDWTVSGIGGDEGGKAKGYEMSFWVKIVTSWITYLFYFWSLLAPYFCCKHRDYGYDVPTEW